MNIGNRFAEKVIAVYFFALTVMMYYFLDKTLNFKHFQNLPEESAYIP